MNERQWGVVDEVFSYTPSQSRFEAGTKYKTFRYSSLTDERGLGVEVKFLDYKKKHSGFESRTNWKKFIIIFKF